MKLYDKKVMINEIIPDNNNPRWNDIALINEEMIYDRLMDEPTTRELLVSMKSGVLWVSRIVVAPIEDVSLEEQERLSYISKGKKYVVVEGNTRLACLRHKSMKEIIDLNHPIDVIIAKRLENESDEEYLKERMRLQNIVHLMRGTGWNEIPKARQFYKSFLLEKRMNPDKTDSKIFKEMADEIGNKVGTVKGYVYKYTFYEELDEMGIRVDNNGFKYLEIFETNSDIRRMFGYLDETSMFIWDNEEISKDTIEEVEKKKELLELYFDVVRIAEDEEINSKTFRNIVRKYKSADIDDLLQKFKDVIAYSEGDDYTRDGVINILEMQVDNEEKEIKELTSSMKKVINTLKSFPILQDYAIEFKGMIMEINKISERLLVNLEYAKAKPK